MKKILRILSLIFLISVIFVLNIMLYLFQKISISLDKKPDYILNILTSLTKNNPYENKNKINFIVLGLDKRNDLLERTDTTDSIMFVSLNIKNQKINTISIPRDLWIYQINSKVNEIYPLSLTQNDQLGYIKRNFANLVGQPIDHVVVLTTKNLIEFVSLIGGVDVILEKGFIDNQYPNPEYIDNPSSTVSKYKTIDFKPGLNHLNSENITEFVRSRKGADTFSNGGTDLARIQRQQLLVEAIINKIRTKKIADNTSDLIYLYRFWDNKIIKDISDQNLVYLLLIIGENINNIAFNKIELPIGTNSKDGLIYHPQSFINKQWVFIPSDKEYKSFQNFFANSL